MFFDRRARARGIGVALLVACLVWIAACGSLGRLRLPPPDPNHGYGITGYVGQSSSLPAANENVTLVDANSKQVVATTTTDYLGRFKIYPLRPGEYVLLAGNKQRPVTISNDHVQLDVDLSSATGRMDYGTVASVEPAAPSQQPSPAPFAEHPGGTAPAAAAPPSGGSGAAGLQGCYAGKYTMIMTQYWFDGQGRFKNINWNPESGTFTYAGSYQIDTGRIVLAFDGGETKVYELMRVDPQGVQWGDATGSWTYIRQGDVCP